MWDENIKEWDGPVGRGTEWESDERDILIHRESHYGIREKPVAMLIPRNT